MAPAGASISRMDRSVCGEQGDDIYLRGSLSEGVPGCDMSPRGCWSLAVNTWATVATPHWGLEPISWSEGRQQGLLHQRL